MQNLYPQATDFQPLANSYPPVGSNPVPLNLDRHTATITACLDQCGHYIREIQTKLQSLEMNQMNVQTLVATSQDDAKATAKELLAKVEDDVSVTARCLDYALSANNRLFEQLESACKHVLDQLTRVAMDPKSLDTIKRGDWAKPAEPQQQAQASELEQLKKKVQDQTAEIEGLKALLEQRNAAHAGEVARLQAQINSLAPNPFQKLAACCFVKNPL